jgi:hypothetical protein
MKKILTLFAVVGLLTLSGCSNDEDNDTISSVYEFSNVNFTAENDYNPIISFPTILPSDMVVLYRLAGTDKGEDVWKMTPELYYFANGTLNFGYNFNFTRFDVSIYMDGEDLANVLTSFRTNQIFRVVIIPGFLANATAKSTKKEDFSDYKAVIAKYNIDDTNIKRVKL